MKIVALFDTTTGIEYQLMVVKKIEEVVKLTMSSVHSSSDTEFSAYGKAAKQAWKQLASWDQLSPKAQIAAESCFKSE